MQTMFYFYNTEALFFVFKFSFEQWLHNMVLIVLSW